MPTGRVVFLLSPANCGGKRAGFLLRPNGTSVLAQRLRSREGATVAEVFTFMSGLYFRGKLAYASTFADPPADCRGVHIIVPGWGLCAPGAIIDLDALRAIAAVPVDPADRRYLEPLQRDARRLAERLDAGDAAVLLGSIATPKYLQPLTETLGPCLRVPEEFIGRGDMSRGALMLRCAREKRELTYVLAAPEPSPARGSKSQPLVRQGDTD